VSTAGGGYSIMSLAETGLLLGVTLLVNTYASEGERELLHLTCINIESTRHQYNKQRLALAGES